MLLDPEQQLKFVTYAPCAVAPLSVIGSCLTLLILYRTHRTGFPLQTYHRLVLGISLSDVVFSLAWAFGPLPMPDDWPWMGANGSTFTCTLQGFAMTLGFASFMYNTSLMIYYLLVIRYSVREEIIAKKIEPIMHLFTILYHLGVGIAGLALEIYNPVGSFCWFAPYPYWCVDFPPCERGGEYAIQFDRWLISIPLVVQTGIMTLVLAVVGCTVWSKYRKTRRFDFSRQQQPQRDGTSSSSNPRNSSNNTSATGATTTANPRRVASNAMEQRSRRVIVQCVLFAVVFINVTVWSSVSTLFDLLGDDNFHIRNFWSLALLFTFLPAQGMFNFFIYIRPRYLSIRGDFKDSSRWFALKESVWYPDASVDERTSRSGGPNARGAQSDAIATNAIDRSREMSTMEEENVEDRLSTLSATKNADED